MLHVPAMGLVSTRMSFILPTSGHVYYSLGTALRKLWFGAEAVELDLRYLSVGVQDHKLTRAARRWLRKAKMNSNLKALRADFDKCALHVEVIIWAIL